MVACLFYVLFVVFVAGHGAGLNSTRSCGNCGPEIRFPFRIKGEKTDHCGYPGFDLSCSDDNSTVLELPTGVSLLIEEIDYRLRLVHARDPLVCFPRKGLNFSLGAPHFQIKNEWLSDWTLFNCSSNEKRSSYGYKIPCLSAFNDDVYAVGSSQTISDYGLLSCTKMYNIYGFPYRLTISWFNPTCGSSEAECYGFRKHSKGMLFFLSFIFFYVSCSLQINNWHLNNYSILYRCEAKAADYWCRCDFRIAPFCYGDYCSLPRLQQR
ncbi:hypothetical protein DKX38_026547 [Salix brachista]|uniref:RING-type E3 ubiquitin transferase n=1 Tax=Salix brachista TaxID=2182728 RepID=A0A5N5J9S6_9ROSI|nr:hypothetical protein DKX38_026547 [Salix brachista]